VAGDPYKYFRIEGREIVEDLGRSVLRLEKEPSAEIVAHLLRLAHTLKGAARVVKQPAIAEAAHAIEDALAPASRGARVPADSIEVVLKLIDGISSRLRALDAPVATTATAVAASAAAAVPASSAGGETARSVHAEVHEIDTLLDSVSEAGVHLQALRQTISGVERARAVADLLADRVASSRNADGTRQSAAALQRVAVLAEELRVLVSGLDQSLGRGLEQVEREMQEVRDAAERLRLIPASAIFAPLERTARDAATTLGTSVAFEASGGEVRLDAHVLGIVQTALLQLVRNAIAHGIEKAAERNAAGKPVQGTIQLTVVRRGNRVAFECRDDGRGIDVDAVRLAAASKGLASPNDSKSLLKLLLEGRISTSNTITEVSGRGIGLDVVRDAAVRLGGEVDLRTEAGRGTVVELVVPVSLSSLDALVVEASGVTAAIPLEAVRRTLRVDAAEVTRTAHGDTIVHEGVAIPIFSLAKFFRANDPVRQQKARTVVVVEGDGALAAIGADRLVGTANVIVRSLPPLAPGDTMVAGASLDPRGDPQLVLDPDRLVAAATSSMTAVPSAPLAVPVRAPVLVIDDSLTTRMLEQSILESAGYDVDVANSAEEALSKARRRRYRLFLVDVEMPGMDGFAFVETARADPGLADIPAILVTSRNTPEDRRRAQQVGARDYMVKSEFDQTLLLATIRNLLT
jgi:two-component system chemotaxis sensor kinase CheA